MVKLRFMNVFTDLFLLVLVELIKKIKYLHLEILSHLGFFLRIPLSILHCCSNYFPTKSLIEQQLKFTYGYATVYNRMGSLFGSSLSEIKFSFSNIYCPALFSIFSYIGTFMSSVLPNYEETLFSELSGNSGWFGSFSFLIRPSMKT